MLTRKDFSLKTLFTSINITIFLGAFFLGLLFIYYFDDKKVITVYPTPHNKNDIEFKDKAENCFSYEVEEIKCPDDEKLIENLPIQ